MVDIHSLLRSARGEPYASKTGRLSGNLLGACLRALGDGVSVEDIEAELRRLIEELPDRLRRGG